MKGDAAAEPRGRLRASAMASVAATLGQTLIGLVLYSYLIRSLGAETVGVWVSLMAVGLLACMADLGLNHVLIRNLSLVPSGGVPGQLGTEQLQTLETLLFCVAAFTGVALLLAYASFPLWSAWLSLAPAAHEKAVRWLPYVLAGLWFNRISDALAGALDGQLRFVERGMASVVVQLAGLLLTVASVPVWGMEGAAGAFVLQNLLLMLTNLVLVARGARGARWLRPRLNLRVLREAMRYGMSVQALVLCYLVLESCIKLALARGGSLSAVSYFDLAFRIAKGVRGLLASAVRVMVPRLAPMTAAAGPGDPARRERAYAASFEIVLVAALVIFSLLLAGGHVIAWLVVGRDDPVFVAALAFALVPWLIYSLTDPVLNLALASGRMRWPLRAHLLTLALGAIPTFVVSHGSFAGWYGLVALAIIAGCGITLTGIHHDEKMPWRLLRPAHSLFAVAAGLSAGLLGIVAPFWLAGHPAWLPWAVTAVAELLFLVLLWLQHPAARVLLASSRLRDTAIPSSSR